MGGLSCAVPHLAIIRPDGLPSNPTPEALRKFDDQLLECCKQSDIVEGLVAAGVGDDVCAILGKTPVPPGQFSAEDRGTLYGFIEALYT